MGKDVTFYIGFPYHLDLFNNKYIFTTFFKQQVTYCILIPAFQTPAASTFLFFSIPLFCTLIPFLFVHFLQFLCSSLLRSKHTLRIGIYVLYGSLSSLFEDRLLCLTLSWIPIVWLNVFLLPVLNRTITYNLIQVNYCYVVIICFGLYSLRTEQMKSTRKLKISSRSGEEIKMPY